METNIKDLTKAIASTMIGHFYQVTDDGITSYHRPRLLNKTYLILGDDKSLADFRQQFHNPYEGNVAI